MEKKHKLPRNKATEVLDFIQSYYDIDLSVKTQKARYVAIRSLLNHILHTKMGMTDSEISEFYLEQLNISFNRSSIWFSLDNFKIYLNHYDYLNDVYNHYFISRAVDTNKEVDSRLKELLLPLKGKRLEEMIEHITIKVKSWEWKDKQPKNEYEIINCEV